MIMSFQVHSNIINVNRGCPCHKPWVVISLICTNFATKCWTFRRYLQYKLLCEMWCLESNSPNLDTILVIGNFCKWPVITNIVLMA
jgi:hypothetical protein